MVWWVSDLVLWKIFLKSGFSSVWRVILLIIAWCMGKVKIAVCIACFNRAAVTIRCLQELFNQEGVGGDIDLTVFLVDDGSTDDTAEMVRQRFPRVVVIRGTGNLFWNRSMILAFESARASFPNYYLMLNDDTVLVPGALRIGIGEFGATGADSVGPDVVVGNISDEFGRISYGGRVCGSGLRRFRYGFASFGSAECDTFNGNFVLLSSRVVEIVGWLDPKFVHGMGDFDYGHRIRSAGFEIRTSPEFVGCCNNNSRKGTHYDLGLGFLQRVRVMLHPKELPVLPWALFCWRHGGWVWPVFLVWPYVRTAFGLRPRIDQ